MHDSDSRDQGSNPSASGQEEFKSIHGTLESLSGFGGSGSGIDRSLLRQAPSSGASMNSTLEDVAGFGTAGNSRSATSSAVNGRGRQGGVHSIPRHVANLIVAEHSDVGSSTGNGHGHPAGLPGAVLFDGADDAAPLASPTSPMSPTAGGLYADFATPQGSLRGIPLAALGALASGDAPPPLFVPAPAPRSNLNESPPLERRRKMTEWEMPKLP